METINILFTGTKLRRRMKETIQNPPNGITYHTMKALNKMTPDYIMSASNNKDINFMLKLTELLRIPNIRYIPKKFLNGINVIHTHGRLLLTNKPYAVEIDNVACLAFYNSKTLFSFTGNRLIKYFLKRKNCKKIICISDAAKKNIEITFNDKTISDKIEVVYPFIKRSFKRDYDKKTIKFLAINTKFHMKGTKWVLEGFDELSKEYPNIDLTVISNTPQEYIEKYKDNKKIKFYPARFSKEELYKLFVYTHDVFIQPSLQDSFGLQYMEALAGGMAIISTDVFAVPEFVDENKNGYLIKAPFYFFNDDLSLKKGMWPPDHKGMSSEEWYESKENPNMVEKLKEKMLMFIKDPGLAETMGKHSQQLLETRFSEEKRKQKLLDIYKKCVE